MLTKEIHVFAHIIEANLEQLSELTGKSAFGDSWAIDYGRIVKHGLRCEVGELKDSIERALGQEYSAEIREFLSLAGALRLSICTEVDLAVLKRAEEQSKVPSPFQGELLMLVGRVYTILNRHADALLCFRDAIRPLGEIGAGKKAVKARLNVLVAQTHIVPDRHYIPEHYDVYRMAMRRGVRELSVASTALLNISREYQKMGAFYAAFKYCSQAVRILARDLGSYSYFLALAHRADVLCDMGRMSEAREDFELALASQFPEVESALRIVAAKLGASPREETSESRVLPTWSEREDQKLAIKLSPLEERLVRFLSEGPCDRWDLIKHLYGERLDSETKLNRFKSLLASLRRKHPSLVAQQNGRYFLTDSCLMERLRSA